MKKIRLFSLFFIFLLFLNSSFASFQADLIIDVDETGAVTIIGESNHLSLQNIEKTQEFTSKKGEYWILNITTEDIFEKYTFELNLPKYSQVNYIKSTPNLKIREENRRITLIGSGENKPFGLIVQYKIVKTLPTQKWYINAIAVLIIIALIILYLHLKKKIPSSLSTIKKEEKTFDFSLLPSRQQEIIKIIQKNKKMTQKELESQMNIPKSSISRNIQTLVNKGIIIKEKSGQTNYLILKK